MHKNPTEKELSSIHSKDHHKTLPEKGFMFPQQGFQWHHRYLKLISFNIFHSPLTLCRPKPLGQKKQARADFSSTNFSDLKGEPLGLLKISVDRRKVLRFGSSPSSLCQISRFNKISSFRGRTRMVLLSAQLSRQLIFVAYLCYGPHTSKGQRGWRAPSVFFISPFTQEFFWITCYTLTILTGQASILPPHCFLSSTVEESHQWLRCSPIAAGHRQISSAPGFP